MSTPPLTTQSTPPPMPPAQNQQQQQQRRRRPSPPRVPYFVVTLNDGKAKALFTVPTYMAKDMTIHPVMCRGAMFPLEIDVVSQGEKMEEASDGKTFISTEYYSPEPEETAKAISQRLSNRMEEDNPFKNANGNFLGL